MRFLAVVFFLYSFCELSAQIDTSAVLLPITTIESSRLQYFSPGSKMEKIDSSTLNFFQGGNVSDVLSAEGPMHVKSYGGGSLATSAFRGGGAAHTAVIWNGFTLNSTMNGIQDFSLLPVLFFDEIKLNYGGGSSHWGSGAMGGAVHLSNQLQLGNSTSFTLGANTGSFGALGSFLKVKKEGKKTSFSVAAYHQEAVNDFKYQLSSFTGREDGFDRLTNAAVTSNGTMANGLIKLNENQFLNISVWGQSNKREIPPILGTSNNEAMQEDHSIRALANWKVGFNKSVLNFKLAHFYEQIEFNDPASNIKALNNANTSYAEAEFLKGIGKYLKWNTGLQFAFLQANTSNYEAAVGQQRIAVFSALDLHWKNWVLSGSVRQDVVDFNLVPTTFGLESKLALNKSFSLKTKGGRIYRLPTLNDLYWSPGGNLNLQPEKGYSLEGGIVGSLKWKKLFSINTELTAFSKSVENWIAWLPADGTWSPFNVSEVWSRGTETKTSFSGQLNEIKLIFVLGTNYVISTNESEHADSLIQGKQLIYTPMYMGFTKIGVAHKWWSFYYRHNYTGYRFVSTDNQNYMVPYDLGTIQLSATVARNKWKGNLKFSVNNIWNQSYQVVLNRPMPMRNFTVGCTINFTNNSKQEKHD